MAQLVLATCQFCVQKDVDSNLRSVLRQMRKAKAGGAQLAHFSEACLSGYLGSERKSASESHWTSVAEGLLQVMALARELSLWVVIGCNHRLSGNHKPHNSLYVIDNRGRLVTRYDKMFCCGDHDDSQDLKYYSPGESFVDFQVSQVRCGLLICHDFRYPELFREYKKRGVQLVLISFHMAGMNRKSYDKYMVTVPATIQSAAASNFFAVSANNGTRRHAFPSFVVNPEGLMMDKARSHQASVLINVINTNDKLFDASAAWRDRCMRGVHHSGTLVRDKRSRNRKSL